jgi:hypothetical protein
MTLQYIQGDCASAKKGEEGYRFCAQRTPAPACYEQCRRVVHAGHPRGHSREPTMSGAAQEDRACTQKGAMRAGAFLHTLAPAIARATSHARASFVQDVHRDIPGSKRRAARLSSTARTRKKRRCARAGFAHVAPAIARATGPAHASFAWDVQGDVPGSR